METVIFLAYALICAALFKRRFSRCATAVAIAAAGAAIVGIQAALVLSGNETLAFTLLPLTAYLPFSILLYFLSDGGAFETAAACSVGALGVLFLKSLEKILFGFISAARMTGAAPYRIADAVVVLAAAGAVWIAFRFIGGAFRFCVIENRQNRPLLSIPVVLVFLLVFYFLNSTTDIIVLILTMLIALSVFLITARLLASTAELLRARRAEKEMAEYMEIRRRGYDRAARKMESDRAYRHDMRHHLTVIEGLAKQSDCERILAYAGKLSGSLAALESVNYCKNPEINAVLTEYFGRAENAGCRISQSIALPEKLPFSEDDVCAVLANAVENAVNACLALPREQRFISVTAECADGKRLFVSVKNPCADPPEFDENGLPVSDGGSEEHGIGLRSVSRIAEKYNGFLRCKLENGEFVFHAALFYEESVPRSKGKAIGRVPGRAASSLLGLGAGAVILLNLLPSTAEAVSSILSVQIRTVHSLRLNWGDHALSIDRPEFDGYGADELNGAAIRYTDEAKEKFLWYFSRSYNGYVAEDMRYTVTRDDDRYFIARFSVTVNAGGSLDYSRWIVFDKDAGKTLALSDLFREGSDYLGILSAEILSQMQYKNENEGGGFFLDGDDAFTGIGEDANFYLDAFDRLVIVFDEYEVAPGFMGSPEFFIPNQVLEEIARWID